MNKRVVILIGVLVVAIVGSILTLSVIGPGESPTATPTISRSTTPTPEPAPTETVAPGRYIAYTPDALADTEGRTFVFFYAPWCGQCRDIDEGILAQGVPDGVTILKADFDTEQALEQQYGVTMRTTFVEIADDGSEIQRFVAYDTPTFDAVIAAMF